MIRTNRTTSKTLMKNHYSSFFSVAVLPPFLDLNSSSAFRRSVNVGCELFKAENLHRSSGKGREKQGVSTHSQSTQTVLRFLTWIVISALPKRSPMSETEPAFPSSFSCNSHAKASASHSNLREMAFMPIPTNVSNGARIIWPGVNRELLMGR